MKKILPLLLAISMIFTLAACGSSSNDTSATPTPTPDEDEITENNSGSDDVDIEDDVEDPSDDDDDENPIIQAIEKRNSTARDDFSGKEISEDVLWLLGWAATGTNRDGTGYVIPLAMGSDPFVSVYLAQERGVRRFSWETNDFEDVSDQNILSQATLIDMSETVTAIWIFVIEVEQVPNDNLTWAYHAVGAMSQNQYLVAEEFDVQARYMAAVDADAVSELLGFDENQLPVGVMMMAQK